MKICILLVDCLRADHLGCYGYNKNTSPHLDEIAQKSFLFARAISQCNWTFPSVYSMITARYPSTHKVSWWDQKINERFPTLPEILAKNGYHTGLFTPFKGLLNVKSFCQHFQERKEIKIADMPSSFSDWLNRSENSFLFLHTAEYVHEPFYADREYVRMFLADGGEAERAADSGIVEALTSRDTTFKNIRRLITRINTRRARLTGKQVEYLRAAYDAGIFYVDKFIGQIYRLIRENCRDYIFIITSDHGQALMEHKIFGHGLSLYEELVHVPLIIDVNGRYTGRSSSPVQLIDLYPTIMDLLDIPGKSSLDGASLVSLFGGGRFPERPCISEGFPYISLTKNGYKMITKYTRLAGYKKSSDSFAKSLEGSWKKKTLARVLHYLPDQLFCLKKDPDEKKNLLWQEKIRYNSLKEELNQLYARINSEGMSPLEVGIDEEIAKQLEALGYI